MYLEFDNCKETDRVAQDRGYRRMHDRVYCPGGETELSNAIRRSLCVLMV
jgi:hypothetical protein